MEKIGFIGVGNMGGALAQAVLRATDAKNVLVSSRTAEKAEAFAAKYGGTATDNRTLAETASVIFLGVKPQKMALVLADIAPVLAARKQRPDLRLGAAQHNPDIRHLGQRRQHALVQPVHLAVHRR